MYARPQMSDQKGQKTGQVDESLSSAQDERLVVLTVDERLFSAQIERLVVPTVGLQIIVLNCSPASRSPLDRLELAQ